MEYSVNGNPTNFTFAAPAFEGDGQNLTNLNSGNLTGTVPDTRLSAVAQDAIAKRHQQNSDTGTTFEHFTINSDNDYETPSIVLKSFADGINNIWTLNCDYWGSRVSLEYLADGLPSTFIFTAPAFDGDGSLLTNVSATNLIGTVADARLSANIPQKNAANMFTAKQSTTFDGVTAAHGGKIFSLDADSGAVANTTSQADFSSASFTFPANSLVAGRTYRVKVMGKLSTTGTPNFTGRLVFAGTTVADSGARATASASSSAGWKGEATFTVRSTGSSGQVIFWSDGFAINGSQFNMGNRTSLTVNTTTTNILKASALWSVANAANTATVEHMTVEMLP